MYEIYRGRKTDSEIDSMDEGQRAKEEKRILFVLTNEIYVRNYLSTGALHELDEIAEVKFAISNQIKSVAGYLSEEAVVGQFCFSEAEDSRHQLLFQLYAWRFRKKSKTFYFRWLRQSNWQLVASAEGKFELGVNFVKWLIGLATNPKLLFPLVAGSKPLFPLISGFLKSRVKPNSDVREIVERGHWDLIMVPTSGADSGLFDFLTMGEERKIPTFAVVDNWDNLVSKTVFWRKPTFLGVWGPQARQQALEIHGFEAHQIMEIGNPRFELYFSFRNEIESRPRQRLLFVGSAMPFDEIRALHHLEAAVSALHISGLEIIYRPHPWQQRRLTKSTFRQSEFQFTSLDEQIKQGIELGMQETSTDLSFQPALDYYPRLFSEARVIIGPLTTMLLEASICLRPVIGLTYNDGFHFNTSLEYFSHFSGMDNFPGFQFCSEVDQLPEKLDAALRESAINAEDTDSELSRILTRGRKGYGAQLAKLVADII